MKGEQIALGQKKGKSSETLSKTWFFESGSEIHSQKQRESLLSLFCKEWRERFAHSHSFVKGDASESHTVAL